MQSQTLKMGRGCAGLSLVELLIAMVLGLTLAAGVSQVYVGNNQTQRDQEAHMRMQENGRFAIHFLSRELRMAGYLGCLSAIEPENINNTLNSDEVPSSFQPDMGIQGWESDHGNGTAPGDIFNSTDNRGLESTTSGNWSSSGGNVLDTMDAMPGSDIVRAWNTSGGGATINSVSGGAATVVNSTITDLQDGDILLLSDCERADWAQACNVQEIQGGASINSVLSAGCEPGNDVSQGLGSTAGGQLVKLQGTMFYVGKRGGDASNPPALFRRQLNDQAGLGTPEELVEGIESIQILYGLNTDNDSRQSVDAWVTADQVPDWGRVISVRISVLVQSIEDNLAAASQPYRFNGVVYDGAAGNGALPGDQRYRRVFTSTITLRNRAVGR
ncbi:MAG: PilW family protein [Pseudohongiellaceae bacterium]